MAGLPLDPNLIEEPPGAISTGRSDQATPPRAPALPIEPGFFDRLKSGDKNTWRAVATALYGLSDIGEAAKPPGQRRQKSRAQEYREGVALEDEREWRLTSDARRARMEEANYALKIAEFSRGQRKDQFDAFGAILTDVSKALDSGMDPAQVMATSAQRAQSVGLDFMVPMLSGAAWDRGFLTRLGPMYELVKDEPISQAFLARSVVLAKPGTEQATKFMADFQTFAGSVAVRTILDRLRNPAYKGKSFDEIASTIAPDNPFVRDVFLGVAPIAEPLKKSVENGLRAIGVKTPEVAGLEEEAGARARAQKMAETDPFIQQRVLAFEKEKTEAVEQIKATYGKGERGEKAAQNLRGDFLGLPTVRVMQQAVGAYSQIEGILAGPQTTATDWALIVGYAKINDPDSVAREGEQAAVKNLASVDDRIANAYDLLLKKKILTPEIRKDIADGATRLVRGRLQHYEGVEKEMRGIAGRSGADAANAVPDLVGPDLRTRIKEGRKDETPTAEAPPTSATLAHGRAELTRLINGGMTRDAALDAMKKKGWK